MEDMGAGSISFNEKRFYVFDGSERFGESVALTTCARARGRGGMEAMT